MKDVDKVLLIVDRDKKVLDDAAFSLDEYLAVKGHNYTVSMLREKAKDIGVE